MICCCSLAGTDACKNCQARNAVTGVTVPVRYTADYWRAVDGILNGEPKHFSREEAKKRLVSIGVMDENENLIPPYDKIFVKRGEE